MDLVGERLTSDRDSSIGALFVDSSFECFLCEDEHRAVKVKGETRIPAGIRFEIKLRTEGGMHERYKARYGEWHQGMLWLQGVPNFEYVYLHPGNDDDDTEGCPLVGMTASVNPAGGGTISGSNVAYGKLYPKVRDVLLRGDRAFITMVDRDRRA